MKRLIWFSLLALVSLAPMAYTQEGSQSLNVERARQVLSGARRDIVEAAIDLTDTQKDPFWNIYNQYEKDRAPLTDRTVQLIRDYATNYSTLTNDQIMKMVKESSANQKRAIDLRTKYAEQMAKKVDPKVGARFYQVDDYITTAARLDVLDNIPFIGDAD
jgi:hypothetical protein